ncbi:MAG: hypothetical protein IJC30_04520 [Alphaproteobacteria bacterium]|nr:hypothetical protein [Alphaproteobacteria bacterium]
MWDKLKEVIGQKENSEKQEEHSQKNEVFVPQDENKDAYEKGFLENNRRERHVQAERIRKELTVEKNSISEGRNLGDVGVTQTPVADWRKILKKSIEEEKDRWSYRRSGAENDYMARVEELEDEGRPDTEVMLDASGSVDIRLLREFLRQLKPLLKSSKLKVGCFDDFAYGFKEIKTKADIDNFQVTSRFGGTNGEAAVRAFSKKKEVNKIIFTDGYLELDSMPEEDLKGKKNIIWIVYENENFSPCCGKVIQVSRKKILSYALNRAHLREGR